MAQNSSVTDRLLETFGTHESSVKAEEGDDTSKVSLAVEVWSGDDGPGVVLNRRKVQRSGRQVVRGLRLSADEALAVLDLLSTNREKLEELKAADLARVVAEAQQEKAAVEAARRAKVQAKEAKKAAKKAAKEAAKANSATANNVAAAPAAADQN